MRIDRNTLESCIGFDEVNLLEQYFGKVSEIVSDKTNKHYAVLLCRRSLVVYEIIRCICGFSESNNILCSDDLTKLKPGDEAIVVDDIIIHGRTVSELYDRLKSMGVKVATSAFYKKFDAEFLNSEVLESYNYICGRDVTETEWHDFSNRLITLILKSKIPYATFTYSFAFVKPCVLKRENCYERIDVQQLTMKESGMTMTVFFDKKYKSDFKLLSNLCDSVCIRQYKSSEDSEVIYIPFVLISYLTNDIFNTIGNRFSQLSVPQSIVKIFTDNMYSMEYRAKFLSFLLSYAYGIISINMEQVDMQRTEIIKSIISKSFNDTFQDVLSLSEERCYKILSLDISNSPHTVQTVPNNDMFFANFVGLAKDDFAKFITNTIMSLHKENERRAYNKTKSLWGCSVMDILHVLNEDINAIGFLISMWDIGKASLTFKECGGCVYGCIADGEQAYRIEHQLYAPYARSVLLLQSSAHLFSNYTWEELLKLYFNYLKDNCADFCIPNDYETILQQCSEFFKNKAITSLNSSGCSFDFESKLYERTRAFLLKTNEDFDRKRQEFGI